MEGEGLRDEGGDVPLVGGRADPDHRGVAAHVLQPLHRLRGKSVDLRSLSFSNQ